MTFALLFSFADSLSFVIVCSFLMRQRYFVVYWLSCWIWHPIGKTTLQQIQLETAYFLPSRVDCSFLVIFYVPTSYTRSFLWNYGGENYPRFYCRKEVISWHLGRCDLREEDKCSSRGKLTTTTYRRDTNVSWQRRCLSRWCKMVHSQTSPTWNILKMVLSRRKNMCVYCNRTDPL